MKFFFFLSLLIISCRMVETLNNLMKNNAIAETLTIRQSILGHSLPLSAYLLKPVQRVLKYHLFMEVLFFFQISLFFSIIIFMIVIDRVAFF